MTTHVFLPVYLDSDQQVLDNSTNSVETLDASYNFVMTTSYSSASNISQFLLYKKSNGNYTFKFNDSYKILFENDMKKDISSAIIDIYNDTFSSGIDAGSASIGRMFVRYITDTLMGHPFAQGFIKNETDIINDIRNSNLHKQITYSLSNNLSTSSFTSDNICLSLLNQFLENSSERFSNDQDDTEYNFPFQTGDFITLFIKMNCTINLDDITSAHHTKSAYDILKQMFGNKENVEFNDNDSMIKINQSIWRIKIELL